MRWKVKRLFWDFPEWKDMKIKQGNLATGLTVLFRAAFVSVNKRMYLLKDTCLSDDIIFD